jgi:Bacterial protein of unknown function (DUF839)
MTLFYLLSTSTLASVPHLMGSVLDPMGRPLPGVTVKVKQSKINAITDATGVYRLVLPPSHAEKKGRQDSLIMLKEKSLIFFIPEVSASVCLTLSDASGKEVARPIDKTLVRGQYNLSPFAFIDRFRSPHGLYTLKLQIGPRTFVHRLSFTGEESRSGIRSAPMNLPQLAKFASVQVDSLLVSITGYKSVRQEILVQEDSILPITLFPNQAQAWRTDDSPYLKPADPAVTITPLLTVGEGIALTGDSAGAFRMGGIPDGLGLTVLDKNRALLFMNHEVNSTDSIHARVGMPAKSGSYVSELLLDRTTGGIRSGRFAFDSILPVPSGIPISGTFSRFCSGSIASADVGFPVPVYLTGEESPDSLAFSKDGPQAVAILNHKAYILPDFGRMAFENIVVVPTADTMLTVAFALEDGPPRQSQLYMYVGRKNPERMRDEPIRGLGLSTGHLHVFTTSGKRDEGEFKEGIVKGRWVDPFKDRITVPVYRAGITAAKLQAWSETSKDGKDSAFLFDRIEDGTYDRDQRGTFYFATTGDPSAKRNRFGRIYKLNFDPQDPVGGKAPTLEIFAQGDSAKGFVSPDNMDIGPGRKMVINEDFNLNMSRPPAVWMLDLETKGLRKLAEINVEAVPATSRPIGLKSQWETSGVIDASNALGAGSWLLNVQAHSVNDSAARALQGVPAGQSLVQGGQLLLLRLSP